MTDNLIQEQTGMFSSDKWWFHCFAWLLNGELDKSSYNVADVLQVARDSVVWNPALMRLSAIPTMVHFRKRLVCTLIPCYLHHCLTLLGRPGCYSICGCF